MTASLFAPWKAPALTLRPYQQEAVAAVYRHLRERDDNPCIVIPTGGGKTPVIATICRDAVKQWGGRVIVLAHVKELLQQSYDKLAAVAPDVDVGLYSAGLNRRDKKQPVIVAGIQSVYERACEFEPFDLAIVDEAHLIPPDGEGMYRKFLADAKTVNPSLRVIGLTATPFRMQSGEICTDEGILNSVCYEIGVKQLIVDGFLSPLVSKAGKTRADTSGLHVRGGEFVASEVESLMDDDVLVRSACGEIVEYTAERKAVLIFAAGVDHGLHVCNTLEQMGQNAGFVWGDMSSEARVRILQNFLNGNLKYLVNVNVLTTGFDAPHIDCVALLRPTLSPGLYYQMVGRGFRLSPGKENCLVLDFGGNVLRHGPVDCLKVKARKLRERGDEPSEPAAKECPQCQAVISVGYSRCPECGYEFPADKPTHDARASDAAVLSGEVKTTEYAVEEAYYAVHQKRGQPDAPRSMRVDYQIAVGQFKSEWICFEHAGFARQKACQWWTKRSPDPIPTTAEEAVRAAKNGALAPTLAITVRTVSGEPYERIVNYVLGDKPEPLSEDDRQAVADMGGLAEEEVPF